MKQIKFSLFYISCICFLVLSSCFVKVYKGLNVTLVINFLMYFR